MNSSLPATWKWRLFPIRSHGAKRPLPAFIVFAPRPTSRGGDFSLPDIRGMIDAALRDWFPSGIA
ncbi:MAG: hypothetical protein ABGW90_07320, partial [Martelella sp.]